MSGVWVPPESITCWGYSTKKKYWIGAGAQQNQSKKERICWNYIGQMAGNVSLNNAVMLLTCVIRQIVNMPAKAKIPVQGDSAYEVCQPVVKFFCPQVDKKTVGPDLAKLLLKPTNRELQAASMTQHFLTWVMKCGM